MSLPPICIREPRDAEDFTEESVRWIAMNPFYAGIGRTDGHRYVTDEEWVRAQMLIQAEIGLEAWLTNLLYLLRQSLRP